MHGNTARQHSSSHIGLQHCRRHRSCMGRVETMRPLKRGGEGIKLSGLCNMIQSSCSVELRVMQLTLNFSVCCVNASMYASNYT